jgi:hypothetical protein
MVTQDKGENLVARCEKVVYRPGWQMKATSHCNASVRAGGLRRSIAEC